MLDTELPPPYAPYQGLDTSKAFVVNTQRYTPGRRKPNGRTSLGKYLGQKNQAIIITPSMTLTQLSRRLSEGAARSFGVEHVWSNWYSTLVLTLDNQKVQLYHAHENTWLACRKLLLTREGAAITFRFAIRDDTSPSQVPTQEHIPDHTPAKAKSGCRYSLRSVATSFGRLLIRAGTQPDPRHDKPVDHKPERQSTREILIRETPGVQHYSDGGVSRGEHPMQQAAAPPTSAIVSNWAGEASVEDRYYETEEDHYWKSRMLTRAMLPLANQKFDLLHTHNHLLINNMMPNLQDPPPYATSQGATATKPIIVTLRHHRLIVGPAGEKRWGPLLKTYHDAVSITSTTTRPELMKMLRQRAVRWSNVQRLEEAKNRYDGLTMTLGRQIVHPAHNETWLVCRQFLLTRDEAAIWYDFGVTDASNARPTSKTQPVSSTQPDPDMRTVSSDKLVSKDTPVPGDGEPVSIEKPTTSTQRPAPDQRTSIPTSTTPPICKIRYCLRKVSAKLGRLLPGSVIRRTDIHKGTSSLRVDK
ncbi:hypothetical protein LTR15_000202 [Elasticomyces elasticus]|nr:hypothetical protein LTR15_000202 [Elasticomyces elasticus]